MTRIDALHQRHAAASSPSVQKSQRTIALVGNPNSGKTTLFNALTRLRQKVGNYPGVTVEKKLGQLQIDDILVHLLDLPGTYSMAVRSPDEKVVSDVILGKMPDTPLPDALICVVDATALERGLYLVTQVLELGRPTLVVLTMMDELKRMGARLNIPLLSQRLGVPVVGVVATKGEGVPQVISELKRLVTQPGVPKRHWVFPPPVERELQDLVRWLLEHGSESDPNRALHRAVMDLSDVRFQPYDNDPWSLMIGASRRVLEKEGIDWRQVIIESRYEWIHSVVAEVLTTTASEQPTLTQRLDAILTHGLLGWAVFFIVMGLMFTMIFSVASIPMDWIDRLFTFMADSVRTHLPPGLLTDLLADGIIAGVGAVVIFLPQILILFLFIALLQDTGYMARAAFMMDRVMNHVGLHGKSFIPLLSSFACAIPGIMATRTIESPRDRLVTILVAPFMTCSARLPVFTLMIAVLLPQAAAWQKALILLFLYLLGVIGAIAAAWVLRHTMFRGERTPFILEMPPYRLPSWKVVLMHMWERSRLFLRRAGTIIFAMSVLLWALMTFPHQPGLTASEAIEHSFAGRLGHALEPLIKPLGYDWRIGIGLIGAMAAREVFVSTMSIVFNVADAGGSSIQQAFQNATWPDGRPLFTPAVCLGLMVYFVYALQCMSTIIVVARETNSWKWPLFQFIYMTAVAYGMAWMTYHILTWLGWG